MLAYPRSYGGCSEKNSSHMKLLTTSALDELDQPDLDFFQNTFFLAL